MFNSSVLSRRALLLGTAAVATAAAVPAVAAIAPPNKILSHKEAFYAYAYGMKVDRIIESPGFDAAISLQFDSGKMVSPPFTVHMSGPDGIVGSFSSTDEAVLKTMLNVLKRKQTLTLGVRDNGPNSRQLGFIIEDHEHEQDTYRATPKHRPRAHALRLDGAPLEKASGPQAAQHIVPSHLGVRRPQVLRPSRA